MADSVAPASIEGGLLLTASQEDQRPLGERSAVGEIGAWGRHYLQSHPLRSLGTVGGQVVLGIRTVQYVFIDLFARRFPVTEFVRQAAFMAGTSIVPYLYTYCENPDPSLLVRGARNAP